MTGADRLRGRLLRGATLLAAVAFAGLMVLIGIVGAHATLTRVTSGLHGLPAALGVHLLQLLCSALGWGLLLPRRLPVWRLFRARWLREAVNSMLPVASVGGAVAGARLLTRDGIEPAEAAAAATADLTGEATSQVLFLAVGLSIAGAVPHSPLPTVWLAAVVLPLLIAVAGMGAAQWFGLFGWVERVATRRLPARLGRAFIGLQDRLAGVYARRGRVAADFGLNFLAWSLGAFEVWVLLRALGQPTPLATAYAIESLGLVARSLAFAIPGGIAAQETGFVLACLLFGIPRDAGLALSLLKRLRELIVGVTGVLYWQWLERRVWLRPFNS